MMVSEGLVWADMTGLAPDPTWSKRKYRENRLASEETWRPGDQQQRLGPICHWQWCLFLGLSMVTHPCNSFQHQEVEAGGSHVQGQHGLREKGRKTCTKRGYVDRADFISYLFLFLCSHMLRACHTFWVLFVYYGILRSIHFLASVRIPLFFTTR